MPHYFNGPRLRALATFPTFAWLESKPDQMVEELRKTAAALKKRAQLTSRELGFRVDVLREDVKAIFESDGVLSELDILDLLMATGEENRLRAAFRMEYLRTAIEATRDDFSQLPDGKEKCLRESQAIEECRALWNSVTFEYCTAVVGLHIAAEAQLMLEPIASHGN